VAEWDLNITSGSRAGGAEKQILIREIMKIIEGTIALDDLKRTAIEGKRSRGVDNPEIREKIVQILHKFVTSGRRKILERSVA
jgi:hypothetical protein